MKGKFKQIFAFLLLFAVSFTLIGCSEKSKKFTSDAGLSIELTSGFYEKEIVSQTMYLESKNMIFTALKEEKDLFEDYGINFNVYSLNQYASLVIKNNNVTTEVLSEGELTYFIYEKTVSGRDFTYKAYVFKSSDAFWLCQFACQTKDFKKLEPKMSKYAKTITLEEK